VLYQTEQKTDDHRTRRITKRFLTSQFRPGTRKRSLPHLYPFLLLDTDYTPAGAFNFSPVAHAVILYYSGFPAVPQPAFSQFLIFKYLSLTRSAAYRDHRSSVCMFKIAIIA
jgi:hypothetical protein